MGGWFRQNNSSSSSRGWVGEWVGGLGHSASCLHLLQSFSLVLLPAFHLLLFVVVLCVSGWVGGWL